MIAKGKSCHHVGNLSDYLLRKNENDKVLFHGTEGTLADDLRGSLCEMEDLASLTNCKEFLYHLSVRPKDGETLTPEQWEKTVSAYEKALNLEGHQRAIVEHVKNGTSHFHIVWSRIDPETMRAVNMGWNYAKHEEVGRELEKEFDLERVAGRFARDPDQERPKYGYDHKEALDARALDFNLHAWEKEVRSLAETCKSGAELQAKLEELGSVLAKGDKVAFMIVDPMGNAHRAPQTLGLRVKEAKALLSDLTREQLPTVTQAQEQERLKRENITRPEDEITKTQEFCKMEAAFKKAYIASQNFETFKAEFERRGYTLHRADDQSPVVALDKEGRVVPLDKAKLSRSVDPVFQRQIEEAKLLSVDQKIKENAEKYKGLLPEGGGSITLQPMPVKERLKQETSERIEEKKQAAAGHLAATLYDKAGMAQQQTDALRDHEKRQKLKDAEAKKQVAARLATERLEKVAAKQATAAPKPSGQSAKAAAQEKAAREGAKRQAEEKRREEERQREEVKRRQIERAEKDRQDRLAAMKAAREVARREAEEKRREEEANRQTAQRRAEEERERLRATAPPRKTQAQELAEHKQATTEQRGGKRSVLDGSWTIPTRSGREHEYDNERER